MSGYVTWWSHRERDGDTWDEVVIGSTGHERQVNLTRERDGFEIVLYPESYPEERAIRLTLTREEFEAMSAWFNGTVPPIVTHPTADAEE